MLVKICGITNESDALLSVALGADALGFVFAPSRRQVSKDLVKDIVRQLPSDTVTLGLFVNERPESVVRTVHEIGLTGAQLHGSEGPDAVNHVSSRVPLVLKAFAGTVPSLSRISDYQVNAVIMDSSSPGFGMPFDWSEIEGLSSKVRLILAGGLRADNVEEAIRVVRPFGVDVSSGVEAKVGKKDPAKLRLFIARSRSQLLDLPGRSGDIASVGNPFLADLIERRSAMLERSKDAVYDWEDDL